MVKKKKIEPPERDEEREELSDEEDILELGEDDIVEEPEPLPVGIEIEDDLDESLFKDGDSLSDDDIDLDKLDTELGLSDEAVDTEGVTVTEEAAEVGESEEEEKDVLSSQDDIDALFEEASREEAIEQVSSTEIAEERPAELEPEVDVDRLVSDLEEKIAARIEEIVNERLPELVLKTVRDELEALRKEFEAKMERGNS
ncbi:MAG: hypothetical protein JRI45_01920 [Deltaproteobacteria bacterium]|nr:hypothetical protein [Deltaproteobacteria bacterium]MBW2068076.1 hypothetical protein [Deltaproteobacteria bacterium]